MSKFENLLTNDGLYSSVNITEEDFDELESLLTNELNFSFGNYTIDCFCIKCQKMRIHTRVYNYESSSVIPLLNSEHFPESTKDFLNKNYSLTFKCTKDSRHTVYYNLLTTSDELIKIGQYPSVKDLSVGDIQKYKNVLGDNFSEYATSLGLISHSVGIGSFVYLRRILEQLVFDQYDESKSELSIDQSDFEQLRFSEKIKALKNYLPEILVENSSIYNIISKGIHELSEEECLDFYPTIKLGIDLILDDLISKKEYKKNIKKFSGEIDSLNDKYKK